MNEIGRQICFWVFVICGILAKEKARAICTGHDDYMRLAQVALPILNILVLQTGHVPWEAGRPFFIVICWAFCISRLVLHFMQ